MGDYGETKRWLTRHGLGDARPTPLLETRLAVRRRAKIVDSVLLAVFLMGAALAHTMEYPPLVVLVPLVVVLLVGQWAAGRWIRWVDRRAGAQLSQRVAHPVELGWSAVLGRPHATYAAVTFGAAVLLAVSVLPIGDSTLRSGAIVVLIGLAAAGLSVVMQLRQLLDSPAVADDETSLMADVIMRVEDARALVVPNLVWSFPAIFLYGDSLGWWNVASLVLVVAGVLALCRIQVRTGGVGTAARRAMAAR